jgi:hypothetical protein
VEDEFEKIIAEEIARDPANAAKVAASRIAEIAREAIDDAVRGHYDG